MNFKIIVVISAKQFTVKKLVKKLTCLIAYSRASHMKCRAPAREQAKKKVIHVKLKSWLRPLGSIVPYLNISLISCFFW